MLLLYNLRHWVGSSVGRAGDLQEALLRMRVLKLISWSWVRIPPDPPKKVLKKLKKELYKKIGCSKIRNMK